MKKLTTLLILGILCIAISSIPAHAETFIYDIDQYIQNNGSNTFTDNFNDETPPQLPDYGVSGSGFDSGRESVVGKTDLLELHSDDAVLDFDELFIGASLVTDPPNYFFSQFSSGYITATFQVNDGFYNNSYFGIEIANDLTGEPYPSVFEEAWMGIEVISSRTILAAWGDTSSENWTNITGVVGSTITMTLSLVPGDGPALVNAIFDWDGDTVDDLTVNAGSLAFTGGYYTGGFAAGQPIPIPNAVWLLGSGLLAIVGIRRRVKP